MKIKYVVINTGFGTENIILFLETVEHSAFKGLNPISAGFCYFSTENLDDCSCYGKSVSLGISSRPEEDTALLKQYVRYVNPSIGNKVLYQD